MNTRLHPFTVVFGQSTADFFDKLPPDGEGVETPASFAHHPAVTEVLDRLAPPESDAVDPTVRGGLLHLLLVAHRYHQAGARTVDVERESFEQVLSVPPAAVPTPPSDALYLQLPPQMVWSRIDESATHEPLDGVFVARADDRILLSAILGLHPDRMGFSQIPTDADTEAWRACRDHVRSPAFEPVMDGGAQAGFRSIVSEAELLRLVQLALESGRR